MFRPTIVLLILVGSVHADTKVWNKNVNFYNRQNWDKGRRPCPSDKIIIQEQSTSIFLQTNGTLKELVLPMDGEIILASNLKIAFSDDPSVDNNCPGQDIAFVRSTAESWLNPNNWNNSDVIPIESDQIPCEYDDVLFPSNSLYFVGLDKRIWVSTLSIHGKKLTSSLQASNYLQSSHGRLQFDLSRRAALSLSGVGCGETTGCKCGNNEEEVLDQVCSNILQCPRIACPNPVKPEGSCCSMCGGFLTLYYDTQLNFNFEQTKTRLVQLYNLNSGGRNRMRRQATETVVMMYMSKPDEDRVQLVLTDNVQGAENGRQASQITQQINADMLKNLASFGLKSVAAAYSEGPEKLVAKGLGGGTAAVIIIALVAAVITVISMIFIMLKRQPIWFKRDELLDADIEMPQMNSVQEPPSTELPAVQFDNPMYNKSLQNLYSDPSMEANGNVEEIGPMPLDGGFYNPMAINPN